MENSLTNAPDASALSDADNGIIMQDEKTSYILNLHFRADATDSLEDKVKKLIRKDVAAGNF